jgi:hypothetical protein
MTAQEIVFDLSEGKTFSCKYDKNLFSEIQNTLSNQYDHSKVEASILEGKMNFKPLSIKLWKARKMPVYFEKISKIF